MKYLVMEVFQSYAVLLDEEGRFVRSANMDYEIGDRIVDPVLMQEAPVKLEKRSNQKINRMVAGILTIAAMIALFVGVNFYQQNFRAHTSIFMMINPEVEMILNRNGKVLEVKGANADGNTLVEDYEPASNERVEVVNELVDRAIAMGFLADGGQVSIAIDTPDENLFEQYGIELRQELDGRTSITIQITDLEHRDNQQIIPAPPVDDDSGYDSDDWADDDSGYDEYDDDWDDYDDSDYDDDWDDAWDDDD